MAEAMDGIGSGGTLEEPGLFIPSMQREEGPDLIPAQPVVERQVMPVASLAALSSAAHQAFEALYTTDGDRFKRRPRPWGGLQSAAATIARSGTASQEPDVPMLLSELQALEQHGREQHGREQNGREKNGREQNGREPQAQEHHQQELSLHYSQQLTFQAMLDASRCPENIQPGSFVPQSLPQTLTRTVPEDKKNDKYWKKRNRDNVSLKRSREKQRIQAHEDKMTAIHMAEQNAEMRKKIAMLKKHHGLPVNQSAMTPEERRECELEKESFLKRTEARPGCREEDMTGHVSTTVKKGKVKESTARPPKTASSDVDASVQDVVSPGVSHGPPTPAPFMPPQICPSVAMQPVFGSIPFQNYQNLRFMKKTKARRGCRDEDMTGHVSTTVKIKVKKSTSRPPKTASSDVDASIEDVVSPGVSHGPSTPPPPTPVPFIPPQSWPPVSMQPVFGSIPFQNYQNLRFMKKTKARRGCREEDMTGHVSTTVKKGKVKKSTSRPPKTASSDVDESVQNVVSLGFSHAPPTPAPFIPFQNWPPMAMQPVFGSIPVQNYLPLAGPSSSPVGSELQGRTWPFTYNFDGGMAGFISPHYAYMQYLSQGHQMVQRAGDYVSTYAGLKDDSKGRHDQRGMSTGSSSGALNVRHSNTEVLPANIAQSAAGSRDYVNYMGHAAAMLPPPQVHNQFDGHFKLPLPVNPFRRRSSQRSETASSDGQDRFKNQEDTESLIRETEGLKMTVQKEHKGLREH